MAGRRPIASRDSGWAKRAANALARSSVTPNRISQASIVFAGVAGGAFWAAGASGNISAAVLLILAAVACQFRLVCNLLDGMVAVEGGKSESDGPFWNEAPDRIADILIFTGAGFGIGLPAVGLAVAALSVLTAYIRELGRAEGMPPDFSGPMAKPHRMAAITAAAVSAALERLITGTDTILTLALAAIALGAAYTAYRRSARLVRWLRARD